jgi:hypothetical protein
MISIRSRFRSPVLLGTGLIVVTAGCAGVPAEYRNASPLALQKSFFGGYKYTYRGGEAAKAIGMVTYTASFRELLSQQPDALAEAERGVPWHYVNLASTAGFAIYSIVTLVNAVNDQSNASSIAELNEASDISGTDIAVMVGLSAVSVASGLAARSHLLTAARLFNNGANSTGAADSPRSRLLSALPTTLRIDPIRGDYGVGRKLRTPKGW